MPFLKNATGKWATRTSLSSDELQIIAQDLTLASDDRPEVKQPIDSKAKAVSPMNSALRTSTYIEDLSAGKLGYTEDQMKRWNGYIKYALNTDDFTPVSISGFDLKRRLLDNSQRVNYGLSISFTKENGKYSEYAWPALSLWKFQDVSFVLGEYCIYVATQDISYFCEWITSQEFDDGANPNAFDALSFTPETLILKEDVEWFLGARDWFKERNVPYRRSYLLSGPPGNGKSSFVKALTSKLGTSASTWDFSANATDSQFLAWMNQAHTSNVPAIMVLEDLDRFFPKAPDQPRTGISLSALLNALDGAGNEPDRIIIVSANHPERMDTEVLTRPGRFNVRTTFANPNAEQRIAYLTKVLAKDECSAAKIAEVAERCSRYSFAFLRDVFLSAAAKHREFHPNKITDAALDWACRVHTASAMAGHKERDTKTGF